MSEPAPLPSDSYDLCVIGAGVSGLCLAHLAATRAHLRVLLLERGAEAGGCLHSVPVGGPEAPGWLELGAHTCYNSYTRFMEIMAGTDFLSRTTPRWKLGFRMVEGGVLRSIPSCLDFWEAARSLPRLIGAHKAGQTAAAYYSRILGPHNWARVFHPALNAVASQETEGFPADALFKHRGARRKDVLRSFAVRGGLGPAAQALAAHPDIHCALGREALSVTGGAGAYRVRTGQETIQARHVALALPPDGASAVLAEGFPELSGQLARIPVRTVKSLGLVLRDPLAHLPRLAGLILAGGPCFSAVSADAFTVPGRRAWSFHFDGRAREDAMLGYACQVLGAAPERVEASYRRDHRMPGLALGHDRWLAELQRGLPATGLMLLGNYLSGLSIEDCAGRALEEFQRVLG